jgi:uncharacterized membrane protein YeaQ/YmgE (transglycosylase-associated protein family)
MVAYLVAGVIVAALAWLIRHGPHYPRMLTLLVFGLAGGTIGGLGSNLAQGESIDHLDGVGFTAAVLVALVLLVGVHVRVRRAD